MRCRGHDDSDKITVEAFDYIEYPKILTQPDANPAELVADALKQFLSRNQVHNDRVAVSVSGQSGLARFIKLPPVEAKKIPDIVRYEARQQIPFDLNDVIWDYQRMGGGSEESGFVLETEIGLFAMKRDAVFRALEPFVKAGIEVDLVQLAPLALYNYVVFDMLQDLPSPETYDPDDPPESIVLVSLGTDATDLVVTNGFKVWQRSVPLGGSHFTKALTKEMKLTFAKAEHLKRNATTAQDPKAVFQAMRPVFNDLQTELQRSLGFFTNLDRTAKIGRVVAMGNAFKLPGLRRYLAQSLGFEIERVEAFRGLVGPEVLATPAFKDNILSFGVCYGLVLAGPGQRRAADEPAAQGNHHGPAHPPQEALGRGGGGPGHARLHDQLCGPLDAVRHREGIAVEAAGRRKRKQTSIRSPSDLIADEQDGADEVQGNQGTRRPPGQQPRGAETLARVPLGDR